MSREQLILGPHVWRGQAESATHSVLSTGFDALDQKLSGGWPWGAITEIFVDRYGSGELSLLMPSLASLSRHDTLEKGWIVWVAPPLIPYAPALARAGVDLDRILLVDPAVGPSTSPAKINENTLWATEQALRSGASVAVLAWLRAASDTVLRRLQLAAEEQRCGLMLFRPEAALKQRSPAALRLRLSRMGAETRIDILKCRGGRPAQISLPLSIDASTGAIATSGATAMLREAERPW